MASRGVQTFSRSLKTLRAFNSSSRDPLTQCLAPRLCRSMAMETALPTDTASPPEPVPSQKNRIFDSSFLTNASDPVYDLPDSTVTTTIYKFPEMEPIRFETYDSKHLYLPLRRDILHRAVIFEGDATRQGTASTKTRYEVHGSHRKIRPQKGTGMARLGTRQSPMLKGGGKSFGPHPRDFSTELPRKVYDLAWRTALSWRYRRGELIVCEDGMDIEFPKTRFAKQIFEHNGWGQQDGRSLLITGGFRRNLFRAVRHAGEDGRVQMVREVDVKDLLELGRVIIEKRALDEILKEHQSDLISKIKAKSAV